MKGLLALLFPACVVEDDDFCMWDASTSGNGVGHSFVTLFGLAIWLD